jgi:anhydro-N-acetylmuramic acid kinase
MQSYRVIGIMSGTSLDGVDMALCIFHIENNRWRFEIDNAVTVPYSAGWAERLSTVHQGDAFSLASTHVDYGKHLGQLIKKFASGKKADFVSSHGHTIFHQPVRGMTLQIGEGSALSAGCNMPVVCDFRTTDVALGGQGAPLVPMGDKLLFSEYAYCLNLGGIANISFEKNDERIAYDISPVNIILNYLAQQKEKSFDRDGELASAGKIQNDLLEQLNKIDYYSKSYPKSLGREDIEQHFFPLINSFAISVEDKLRTFCEHIAIQIATSVNLKSQTSSPKLLITGGGALNTYLISRLKDHCKAEVIIPEKKIIEFKEALIFAFLGVLRWRGEINCLKSVTGAKKDSCVGAIYLS